MTEESAKTYVFDSARGSMDPSTLLALMNNGGGFGGGISVLDVLVCAAAYADMAEQ